MQHQNEDGVHYILQAMLKVQNCFVILILQNSCFEFK